MTLQTPILTPEQMAHFLMVHFSDNVPENIRNDFRRRNLELFEQIHEPNYVMQVRKLLETKYREKKKNAASKK